MVEYSKGLGETKKTVSSNENDHEAQSNILNIESTTLAPPDEIETPT